MSEAAAGRGASRTVADERRRERELGRRWLGQRGLGGVGSGEWSA
ncbi:hypothetical protein [Frankia umida]|nr:hypothetical protein [Frankia umida]